MRVLLIGGSGFIGGHTARLLLDAGYRVTVLARGHREPVAGAESLVADRRDPAALARVLEGLRFDFTVDFAAYDASDIERLLLVPYAALGRYVMISTGQVYLVTLGGQPPYREEDSERPVMPELPPDSPDRAGWEYGVGKRRAEGALLSLRAAYGVRGVILRLPIVLGAGDTTLRLWAYLERLLDGGPIVLPDGGRRIARFLYVEDVARVVRRLLESRPPREAIYNLAQPESITLRELVERLGRAAGVAPRLVDASWDELGAAGIDRSFSPLGGPWTSWLDPSRAGAEWGFLGTRVDEYLPAVTNGYLADRPPRSHEGYALRPRELELAARLGAAAR